MFSLSQPELILGALLLLAVIAGIILISKKKKKYSDVEILMPTERRNDILYGYYSSLAGQYQNTKDHVNLFWFSGFFNIEEFIEILKGTDKKIVLDVGYIITVKNTDKKQKLIVKDGAEFELRTHFQRLKDENVLHKITYLYPIDEPQFSVKDETEHKKLITLVKNIAKEFSELDNVKYAVIYGRHEAFWNLAEHDVVGVDDYDQKSQILTNGEHNRLVKSLNANQKTFLIPGAAFGQTPQPFVAYAHNHPEEVEGIIPFLWFDDINHKDVDYTGLEARDPEFKQLWIDAAHTTMNSNV